MSHDATAMANPVKAISEQELAANFQLDATELAITLIGLYSLKFKQQVDNLSNPLMRWLDFRFRYIDPLSREVVYSNRFPKVDIPRSATGALNKLVALIKSGGDVNPFQGRGLTLRNDTSGNQKEARTDLLWADWGIHHFHLSDDPIPKDQYFSKPADYLAFCIVGGDLVAFIDVLPHPKREGFANPTLINAIFENWPDYMAQYQLKGIWPDTSHTQAEIHTLRANGIHASLNFAGCAYMGPGMGVTSASTPTKIVIAHNRLVANIDELARVVCDPSGQFHTPEIANLTTTPVFSLTPTSNGLAVYEKTSRQAFLLPRPTLGKPTHFLEVIHDLLLPEWASGKLSANAKDSPA